MTQKVEWVFHNLVETSRSRRLRGAHLKSSLANGALIRIDRGLHLDTSALPEGLPPWELRKIITIARLFAVQGRVRSASPVLFTGECSLLARGVDTWWNTPDISYRAATSRRSAVLLPEVQIRGILVEEVIAKHLTGGLPPKLGAALRAGPLRLAQSPLALADMALTAHPLQVFVAACSLLHREATFTAYQARLSRRKEKQIKLAWLKSLQPLKGSRGYRNVTGTVNAADAGCASPMEAALLWALKCVLDKNRAALLTTQHEIVVGSQRYYVDICCPRTKAVAEIDGAGKFGTENADFSVRANRHVKRHRDITSLGWKVLHVTAQELDSAQLLTVAHKISVELGLAQPNSELRPRGLLYQDFNAGLFDPGRRH